ncbi:putative inactive ATP-dependent zinc metalloprotease FTSHI 5 [Arachis hypogaea]|nr:putative inactive ATP-dependent zinc metalloprotease FTSHI 5 [Arachis hypogaea]
MPLQGSALCFTLGVTALGAFSSPPTATAIAVPAVVKMSFPGRRKRREEKAKSGHEYADCTEKLLETVSVLLRMWKVLGTGTGNGGGGGGDEAKGALGKRAGQIIDEILAAKGEYEKLRRKEKKKGLEEEEKLTVETIEKKVAELEDEYNGYGRKLGI